MVSKKNLQLIVVALCVVVFVFLFVWLNRLEPYCFVQDASWDLIGVTDEIKNVRRKLLKDGIRLKIITVEYDDKTEADYLRQQLSPLNQMKKVLINPVIANGCNHLDINLKELCPETEVIAITRDNSKQYFTRIFIPDTKEIWEVARNYVGEAINLRFCKTANRLYDYMKSIDLESDFKVAVDFKLMKAVPKKNLAAVVIPDFYRAFKYDFGTKESSDLEYIFRLHKMEFEYSSDTSLFEEDIDEEKKGGLTVKVF